MLGCVVGLAPVNTPVDAPVKTPVGTPVNTPVSTPVNTSVSTLVLSFLVASAFYVNCLREAIPRSSQAVIGRVVQLESFIRRVRRPLLQASVAM